MAVKRLELARREHADAFVGLVAWLKQDVALRRVVKVWRAWEGDDDDSVTWATDDEVGVRLTPDLGPSSVEANLGNGQRLWSRPLDVLVEVYVASSRASDMLDLPDAIAARITPRNPDVLAALSVKLAEWGVVEVVEVQAPTPAEISGQATQFLGKYRLEMLIVG